jgi:uncharacterized membrane protein (UPF0182 family)
MSTTTPVQRRRRIIVGTIIGIVIVLTLGGTIFSSLYSETLWYNQLGFSKVLFTQWGASAGFFAIGFVVMAAALWLGMFTAYRVRPVYARLGAQMDRYQQAIDPVRRLITIVVPVVLGFFGGLAVMARWQETLLFFNSAPTGTLDPQFGKYI